jgi:hypothetical protein
MKNFVLACAMVMLLAGAASAGDLAVSASMLDDMGLAGMQTLSDRDGLAVRGKGPFDMFPGGLFGGVDMSGIPPQFSLGSAFFTALSGVGLPGDVGIPPGLGLPPNLGLPGEFGGLFDLFGLGL